MTNGANQAPLLMDKEDDTGSVDDKELGAEGAGRTMGLGLVGHLIADPGRQHITATIGQFGMQFPLKAEQDMALGAPVIGDIAWAVLHHPYPQRPELARAPAGFALLTGMKGLWNLMPVGQAEWQIIYLH